MPTRQICCILILNKLSCDGGASYCEAPFTYTYDNQGQLIQATDGTNTYSFYNDGAGNILSATKNGTTHTYTYGDANWKDLLTAYDGQSITYDGAGNPTSYYNGTRWSFTWGNGRRLETASNGTDTISYNYTADGIRTSKTVNGVVHTYYYSGGLLRRETYGDTTLDFFYDANGTPFSMLQNRSAMYYYITNLQGDVIRLVDYLGNTAAYYEYDPHGNAIKASGSHCNINPLRYRGYYYDTETGLYYLQSRYYDPQVGRFINADIYASTGQGILGNNMFTYCLNNVVTCHDVSGTLAAKIDTEITPFGLSIVGEKKVYFPEGTVSVVVAVSYDSFPTHTAKLEDIEIEVGYDSIQVTFPDGGEITMNYDQNGISLDSYSYQSDLVVSPTVTKHGVGANFSTTSSGAEYSIGVFYTLNIIDDVIEKTSQKLGGLFGGNSIGNSFMLSSQSNSLNFASMCGGGSLRNVTLMFV